MKKTTLLILAGAFAVGAVTTCLQCKDDPVGCTDERLGDLDFHGPSLAYCSLRGSERLVFKAANGSELVMTCPSPKVQRIPVRVEKLCQDFNLNDRFAYYDGQSYSLKFQTNDAAYNIEFQGQIASPLVTTTADSVLIDVLSAIFYSYNTGASATVITSERGNSAKITPAIRQEYTFGTEVGDTTFNGVSLTGVFAGKVFASSPIPNDQSMVYLKKGKPVVAFTNYEGKTWVLDRIE